MLEPALFEDVTDLEMKVRSGDADTSWKAAALMTVAAERDLKQSIYALLVEHGPMTDDELFERYAEAGGRRTSQRVRTARAEMCATRKPKSTVEQTPTVRATGELGLSAHEGEAQTWEAIR